MKKPTAVDTVATISKSRSSEIRVQLTTWRGDHKIELREATATIPGVYMPTPHAVTLDITLLPELMKAIAAAEAEARKQGLL